MKATKTNLGYLFTKAYFRLKKTQHEMMLGNNEERQDTKAFYMEDEQLKMKEFILQARSKNITDVEYEAPDQPGLGNRSFELTTLYPGLLVGSGYMHDLKQEKAFKLGFYFDHTTGFPVIPGSSIKGLLRSAFKNKDYVEELLKTITSNEVNVSELEDAIFEGTYKGKNLPLHQRDIFFDAFPVKTQNPDKKFLANDYITPHTDGPLKNPKPLQFLKVLPQVTFKFEFILHDFKNENGESILSAEDKLKLFKQILLDLGVGAKTNVGYGQFKDHSEKDSEDFDSKIIGLNEGKTLENLQSGDVLEARIVNLKGGIQIDTEIPGMNFSQRLTGVSPKKFSLGQIIKVKVIIEEKKGKKYYKFEKLDE